jgi:hypothetical protein
MDSKKEGRHWNPSSYIKTWSSPRTAIGIDDKMNVDTIDAQGIVWRTTASEDGRSFAVGTPETPHRPGGLASNDLQGLPQNGSAIRTACPNWEGGSIFYFFFPFNPISGNSAISIIFLNIKPKTRAGGNFNRLIYLGLSLSSKITK